VLPSTIESSQEATQGTDSKKNKPHLEEMKGAEVNSFAPPRFIRSDVFD
jgi:hypothetical protein